MTVKLVAPTSALPGANVHVSASGLDDTKKAMLTTVDSAGTESGWDVVTKAATNINRPAPDGTLSCGIRVPPVYGPAAIRLYQGGIVVAAASLTVVRSASVPFRVPSRLPTGDRT